MTTKTKPPRRRALPTLSPCACGRKPVWITIRMPVVVCPGCKCIVGPRRPTHLVAANAWNRVMRAVKDAKAKG
jgi:hypothetical protein